MKIREREIKWKIIVDSSWWIHAKQSEPLKSSVTDFMHRNLPSAGGSWMSSLL